jgi:hypothetical protein
LGRLSHSGLVVEMVAWDHAGGGTAWVQLSMGDIELGSSGEGSIERIDADVAWGVGDVGVDTDHLVGARLVSPILAPQSFELV